MNNSHSRTHYRTVYSTNKRRVDPATAVGICLVLLVLAVFFFFLIAL